jgi:hypothetical protein
MIGDLQALRAIFDREARHRPHWPQAWEQAQADALVMAILRTMAAHPSAAFGRRASITSDPRPWDWDCKEPMPANWRPAPPHVKPARSLDFKSLAAGEKPDADD